MTTPAAHVYLKRWLTSPGAQPPVIVHSHSQADLNKVLAAVMQEETCEVVREAADSATITIQAVRRLCARLSRTALARRRLVIIEGAERLSLPAVQALLKPLEEPSATTRWLLQTRYPQRLPATIRSRCQILHLAASAEPARAQSEIEQLAAELREQLYTRGPSPELRLAYTRLRDYYHIVSWRGNEKLAREVALTYRPHRVV